MKNESCEYSINDVVELIRNGINVKQSEKKIGYPVTRIETISKGRIDIERVKYAKISNNDLEKYKLKDGDILFSHINSTEHIAKTAIYEGKPEVLIHGINLLLLRPRKEIVFPKYLLYLLKTNHVRAYFSTRCKKAVNQSSLNQQDIKSVNINIPPLPIQRKVTSILETCESTIQKRKQANHLTNEFLKSTFLEMFGDPVMNTENQSDRSIGDMLENGTLECLDSMRIPLKESDRAKIKGDIPYYGANGQLDSINDHIFDDNLLLLAEDGGSWGRFDRSSYRVVGKGWVNNHAHVIKTKDETLLVYLEYAFNIGDLTSYISGTTRGKLTQQDMRRITVKIPSKRDLAKFADIVREVEKLKQKQRESEKELTNLSNCLMQRAFRGEL